VSDVWRCPWGNLAARTGFRGETGPHGGPPEMTQNPGETGGRLLRGFIRNGAWNAVQLAKNRINTQPVIAANNTKSSAKNA
jgi:hypothetical protein